MNYKVFSLAIALFLASSRADKCYSCDYVTVGSEVLKGSSTCAHGESLNQNSQHIDCPNGCLKVDGPAIEPKDKFQYEILIRHCAPEPKFGCGKINMPSSGLPMLVDACYCRGDYCNGGDKGTAAVTINTPQVVTVLVVSAVIALATQY